MRFSGTATRHQTPPALLRLSFEVLGTDCVSYAVGPTKRHNAEITNYSAHDTMKIFTRL